MNQQAFFRVDGLDSMFRMGIYLNDYGDADCNRFVSCLHYKNRLSRKYTLFQKLITTAFHRSFRLRDSLIRKSFYINYS